MSRQSFVCLTTLFVSIACSSNAAKDSSDPNGSGGDSAGSSGDSGTAPSVLTHESGFSLTTDDVQVREELTATATYAVELNESGVSGFINYAETNPAGTETCSAVLHLRTLFPEPEPHPDTGAPSPADEAPCEECDYGHRVQTDRTRSSGACRFPSTLVALDQAPDFVHGAFELVFSVHDDGSTLMVDIVAPDGSATPIPIFEAGTASFSSGVLSGTNTVTDEVVDYWDRSCVDAGTFTQYFTMLPGELALSDALSCPDGVPAGTIVYDAWERSLDHGETLSVAVRSSDQSLLLSVVGPNECLTPMYELPQSCDGSGSGYCQSIEQLAQEGGPYRAVIEGPCEAAGVLYEFDARVF